MGKSPIDALVPEPGNSRPRVAAVIQARMNSKRLPGKVLANVAERPLLQWQIERLGLVPQLDEIIVATSIQNADDPIAELCDSLGVSIFRGSEDDVLGRVTKCLVHHAVDVHVEVTGDSPLVAPEVLSAYLDVFELQQPEIQWISSAHKTTFPPGTEFSIHRASLLKLIDDELTMGDAAREHVNVNVLKREKQFPGLKVEAPTRLSMPNLYLEVDYPQDLHLIRLIYKYFHELGQLYPSLEELIEYGRQFPEIIAINQDLDRRWEKFREPNNR